MGLGGQRKALRSNRSPVRFAEANHRSDGWRFPGALNLINTALGLLAVIVLIGANGFFVAAEFALVAVDRAKVDNDAAYH